MIFFNALKNKVLFLVCLISHVAHSADDIGIPIINSDHLYSGLRATIEKHGVENADTLVWHPTLQPINVWDVSSLLVKISETRGDVVASYVGESAQQSAVPVLNSSGNNGMDAVRSLFTPSLETHPITEMTPKIRTIE
jgi:hypothetical protein